MKFKTICIDNTDTNLILYKKYLVRYPLIVDKDNDDNTVIHGSYQSEGLSYLNVYYDNGYIIDMYDEKRFKTIKKIRNERIKELYEI